MPALRSADVSICRTAPQHCLGKLNNQHNACGPAVVSRSIHIESPRGSLCRETLFKEILFRETCHDRLQKSVLCHSNRRLGQMSPVACCQRSYINSHALPRANLMRANQLMTPGGLMSRQQQVPLFRRSSRCALVCAAAGSSHVITFCSEALTSLGHRLQELAPLMLFTFGKAAEWLSKPFHQGPFKELLGSTVADLAMAAGGLILSIIATGAWKSLPGLRSIAKEVEETRAPYVVPADYYPRGPEDLLLLMLEGDPRDITLLTGPPSSGKTATIARVLQRREERKESSKADTPVDITTRTVAGAGIYVNMRFGDFLGSSQMGCELSRQFRDYIESLSGIADAEVRRVLGKEDQVRIGVQVLKALKLTKRKPPEEVTRWIDSLERSQVGCEGVETAVKKIEQILRRLRPGLGEGVKAQVKRIEGRQMLRISDGVEERLLPPVIVIDGAEELMRWQDPVSLATLLRFFVGVTAERRQAHVVLVTSDAKMQAWLEEKVGAHLVTPQVLGDLPKAAAARFFDAVARSAAADVIGDVSFDDVWAVSGGRIALMQRLLERARVSGSLRTALQAERAASKDRLARALAGVSDGDVEALQRELRENHGSPDVRKLAPLLKADVLRKQPWSELGSLGNENADDRKWALGSGLEFTFPADAVSVAEFAANGKRKEEAVVLPLPSDTAAASENGQASPRKKSFYEV